MVEVPADRSVAIQYNADGSRDRVTRYIDAAYTNQKSYTEFAYHGDGQVEYMDHWRSPGGTGQYNLLASYQTIYDSRRLLTGRHSVFNPVDVSAGALLSEDLLYEHDAQGQLKRIGRQESNGSSNVTWTDFTYDESGRPQRPFTLAYDAAGNIVSKTAPGPSYDVTNYTWDLFGRLIEVEKRDSSGELLTRHKLGYDALGRHIATNATGDNVPLYEVGTTALIRDADAVVMKLDLGGPHDRIEASFLNGPQPGKVLAIDIHGDTACSTPFFPLRLGICLFVPYWTKLC